MKKMIPAAMMILGLWACGGTGDRTHEMSTITDSASYQVPADTQTHLSSDTTATTNNNAYKGNAYQGSGAQTTTNDSLKK